MYAVIKTGGKQYKVSAGDYLRVEKLNGDVSSKVIFDKILMLADGDNVTIGSPFVDGAKVNATVLSHGKGDKVMVFKFNRRKHYRKTQGHRQRYTEIKIEDVNGKSVTKAEAKPAAVKKIAATKPVAKKAAAVKPTAVKKTAATKPVVKKAAVAKPAAVKKTAAKKPAVTKAKSANKE